MGNKSMMARRLVSLLLIVIVVVSATMTGALAVQGSHSRINQFFGDQQTPEPTEPPEPTTSPEPTNPPGPVDPPGPSTINITANKVWVGDTAELRPASVNVQLYRNGNAYGSAVTLTAAGGWTHTWRSLSDSYTYSIGEVSVPIGYTAAVEKKGNTFTITNTYITPAVSTTQVTVNKVWAGEAPHPASVGVTLYKDGAEYATIVLNDANGWTHTWKELSRDAQWSVGEPVVPEGYTVVVSSAGSVFTLTNTKIIVEVPPRDDEVIISGQKLWRHGANAEADHPASVTIYILADGIRVKEVSVAAPQWAYSVTMPKYDETGAVITYTVDEKTIPGYSSVVKGFTITNVHDSTGTGGPKTGDTSMMLIWFIILIVSSITLRFMLRNTTLRRRRF